jgi:hypothetical protein
MNGNHLRHTFSLCVTIFLLAFAVRTLTWQDNRRDAWKVQTYVTSGYKDSARQLARAEIKTFMSDTTHLGHPPGYPILLAGIFKLAGESDTVLQFIQITVDSAAAVLLFLIALELLPLGVAFTAGLLAALSPQFAYFSVLLLPDSLIVFPILLAVYLIARSRRGYSASAFLLAGGLVGLSCWLRANALLLPLFLAALALFVVPKRKKRSAALSVIAGAVLVIAPITIKNALVFHSFVPVSLGAGQTLLEGIADYDEKGTLNIPNTDLGLMRQEAEWYAKPEYAKWLFGSEGIARDRMRVARGLDIIGSHPLWFASVILRRGLASTRLDPVPVLLPESPVSHNIRTGSAKLSWQTSPSGLMSKSSFRSDRATFTFVGNEWLRIEGDENNYGSQLISEPIDVEHFHDYVLKLSFRLERGRALVKIVKADGTKPLASSVIDLVEGLPASNQPVNQLEIPFVSANTSRVQVVIANSASVHPVMLVGAARVADLGPSSLSWLRYVRMPLGILQRFFTTAWVLPFVVVGIVLLIRGRKFQELAILLTVPVYYLVVQSALHTERRYVYVIHFFFLILASTALHCLIGWIIAGVKRLRQRSV